MKRINVILATVLVCAAANAQTWIGGTACIGVGKFEHPGEVNLLDNPVKLKNEKTLQIFPTIGYEMDEKWEFGASFGFGHKRNIDGLYYGKKRTEIMVSPFARYCVWDNGIKFEKGDLSCFIQANLLLDVLSTPYDVEQVHGFKTFERDRMTFGASIQPGIRYIYDEHFIFTGTFGSLYAEKSSYKSNDRDPSGQNKKFTTKSGKAGLDIDSELTISLAYMF
ncbi:MAG: hypothetical protein MJZ06_02970 [Bacteroidaceae bacterium]|nr:hypothetical protein [Bacteroidaceae bacterium]